MCLREQNSCFLGPVCARDQQPTSAVRSLPFSTNNKLQKNKTFIARPKGPSPRKPSYSHRIDDPTRDDDVLKTVRCCEAPKIEGSHRLADKMEARIQKSVARFSAPAQGSWKSEGKIKPDCNSYSPGMYMGFLCLVQVLDIPLSKWHTSGIELAVQQDGKNGIHWIAIAAQVASAEDTGVACCMLPCCPFVLPALVNNLQLTKAAPLKGVYLASLEDPPSTLSIWVFVLERESPRFSKPTLKSSSYH